MHPTISPYETFETADGWINIGVANDKFWVAFCEALNRDDLRTDARFRSSPDRVAHRSALKAILDPVFRAEPRRHWMAVLAAAGVPIGEIKTVGEACTAPQLAGRGMVRHLLHPAAGEVTYIAGPIRFDEQPPQDALAPPRLGEHTTEVLSEWLGLDTTEVEEYAAAAAFGLHRDR